MKKLFFTLSFIFIIFVSYSQKYLQCDTFIVKVSGVDMINNNVRYDMITATDTIGVIEYIPNIWQFVEGTIGLFDIGKKIKVICTDAITELLPTNEKFKNCIVKP